MILEDLILDHTEYLLLVHSLRCDFGNEYLPPRILKGCTSFRWEFATSFVVPHVMLRLGGLLGSFLLLLYWRWCVDENESTINKLWQQTATHPTEELETVGSGMVVITL
eukprot:scaffold1593_cov193-Alexandrium_tamarense.AAC.28